MKSDLIVGPELREQREIHGDDMRQPGVAAGCLVVGHQDDGLAGGEQWTVPKLTGCETRPISFNRCSVFRAGEIPSGRIGGDHEILLDKGFLAERGQQVEFRSRRYSDRREGGSIGESGKGDAIVRPRRVARFEFRNIRSPFFSLRPRKRLSALPGLSRAAKPSFQ